MNNSCVNKLFRTISMSFEKTVSLIITTGQLQLHVSISYIFWWEGLTQGFHSEQYLRRISQPYVNITEK